jgi:elongation factor Tu
MSFFKKLFGSSDNAQTFEPPSYKGLGPFRMTIEDVFSIHGRGTVVTGKVESGTIKVGDTVEITGGTGSSVKSKVTGIEMFRKITDTAKAGDNIGCLLQGVNPQDVEPGRVLTKT